MTVGIRRATRADVDFLVELVTHEAVEPFLAAVRAKGASEILDEVERSQAEPDAFGVFVIEVDGVAAGTMRFERSNRRSRIADVGGLAVHPDFRGGRVADEAARLQRQLVDDLGFHRVQLEIYGFNERAQAHAERAGFTREGFGGRRTGGTTSGSTACCTGSSPRTWRTAAGDRSGGVAEERLEERPHGSRPGDEGDAVERPREELETLLRRPGRVVEPLRVGREVVWSTLVCSAETTSVGARSRAAEGSAFSRPAIAAGADTATSPATGGRTLAAPTTPAMPPSEAPTTTTLRAPRTVSHALPPRRRGPAARTPAVPSTRRGRVSRMGTRRSLWRPGAVRTGPTRRGRRSTGARGRLPFASPASPPKRWPTSRVPSAVRNQSSFPVTHACAGAGAAPTPTSASASSERGTSAAASVAPPSCRRLGVRPGGDHHGDGREEHACLPHRLG